MVPFYFYIHYSTPVLSLPKDSIFDIQLVILLILPARRSPDVFYRDEDGLSCQTSIPIREILTALLLAVSVKKNNPRKSALTCALCICR